MFCDYSKKFLKFSFHFLKQTEKTSRIDPAKSLKSIRELLKLYILLLKSTQKES